jgi:hypothetical protein
MLALPTCTAASRSVSTSPVITATLAVVGLFIWARIDDQLQRSFVKLTQVGRRLFRITKTSEAVCMKAAVSDRPMAARRWFRDGYHEV